MTIEPATTYQRWDGFGGAFNEMGWDALSVVSSQIPTAMKLLFDPNEGLNFVYGRIPLGASDFAMSWYTLDDTANNAPDYTMSSFSIARDQQKLIPFIKAAMQVRSDVHLWASPWTLPNWMTTGTNPNAVKSDAQTMQALALYFARFVEEYAKIGLPIENVSPQNEPGYAFAQWPGTLFTDFIKTYMGPTFAQRNLTAGVMAGTMSAPQDGTLAVTIAGDAQAMKYVKIFGMQWNSLPSVGAVAASPAGTPIMQTEHRCGNYPSTIMSAPYWDFSNNDQAYNPNMAQNDHTYGEASWQLIRDWIVAGVNSYSAWNMVLDTVGKNVSGWPQNALLVVDRSAKTLTATPAYYAFRHFTQVLPGATRIGISGSKDAVAFKNPDGTLIAEIYNSDASPKTTTLGVGTAGYQISIPAHGWATLRVSP